jgi:hypothetical protein
MTMKNIIIFILLLCSIQMSAQKINSLTQNLSLSNNNINISNGSGVSLDILQSSNTVIRQSPTLTLKNSTQDVLTINGNGVNILNAGTDNTATVIYGKDPGNGAVVEITDLAAFSGASNRLYQAATYSNITAINYPLLTVGDRIKVMDTGAEYLVQATSVPEFVTDEHAVITVGSNYAVLQPQNGEINATWLGLDESLGDATSEIQDAYAYAAALNVGLIADLGTYKVNNANLNGATYAPPYVDLKGATFIPVDESFTDYIIRVYNCYDVKNFNVDASSIDTVYDQGTKFLQIAADGINPLNVKNVNVTGLAWTTNVNGVGNHQNLLVSNNNGNLRTQNNITIEDCYLKDADYAAINIPINQNSTTIVKNVRIENYKQRSITTNGGAKYYVYPPTIGQDTITVDFQPIEGASFYINPENASGTGNTHARYIITDYAKIGNFYRITLDRGLDAAVASNDIVCTVSGSLIMDNLHVTVDSTAIDFTIQGGGVIDPINMIIENCILKNSRFEGYGYLGVGLKFDYYRNLVIENTVINNVNPSALGLPIQAQYATNIANVLEDPQFISTINNSYIGGRLGRDAFTNYTNNTTLEGASDTQIYLYNTNLDSSRHYLTNVEFRNAETTCIYNSATGSTFDITNCTVTTDNPAIGQETTDAFFLSVGTYAGQHRINGLTKPDYMRTYSLSADNSIALTNFGDEVYIRDNAPFISSSTRWAHGARRIFRADQALNPGNYRAGDVMINDHYDSADDILQWIHDGTAWQPQYNSNAGSNKLYQAATYSNITALTFPTLAVGDRIKVMDTGAEYSVSATTVATYNGGVADEVAVITVGSNFAVLQDKEGVIYADWFGSTLNNAKFNDALEYAENRILRLGEKTYDVQTTCNIPSNITIQGTRGKSIVIGVFNFGSDNSNIIVEGITFQVPPETVWAHGVRISVPTIATTGNYTIRECDFIDAIIFSDGVVASPYRGTGLLIEDCTFYLDAESQSSVNPMAIYMNDMEVRGCSFETYDADQSIKLSEGGGYCRITNNKFIGRHLEEVIDGYSFRGEIVFSYNEMDISEGGVYRSKPGANPPIPPATSQYPYPRRLEVSHNKIRERGNGSNLIYAAGAFTLSAEDSIQSVIVSDNIIQCDTANAAINIRGYHQAIISNNTISAKDYAVAGIGAVSIKNLNISNNIVDGKISITSGNTPAGEAYGNTYDGIVKISDNIVYSDTSNIAIRLYDQNIKSITFDNNIVIFDKSNAQYAFRIEASSTVDAVVIGNTVSIQGTASASANQIELTTATITGDYKEIGNSFTVTPWTSLGNDIKSSPTSGNSVIIGTLDGTGVQESLEVGGNIASSNGYILGAGAASEIGKWYNTSGKNILGGINRDWVFNNATDNYAMFDATTKALVLTDTLSGASDFRDPDNSAILDIYSETKGLLIPRMTTVQRNAISAATGLQVYDTDTDGFWYYNGASWIALATSNVTETGAAITSVSAGDHAITGPAAAILTLSGAGVFNISVSSEVSAIQFVNPGIETINGQLTGAFTGVPGNSYHITSTDGTNYFLTEIEADWSGWEYLKGDDYTSGSKLSILETDTSVLINNGKVSLLRSQLPLGIDSLYNRLTNKFEPIKEGDMYTVRIDFMAETSINGGYFTLAVDIGGTQHHIVERVFSFPKGSNTPHPFSFSFNLFTLNTFLANGGEFKVISGSGTTEIWDIGLLIEKTHHAR